MNAPAAPTKRGAGFWILVIGGGLGVCCGGPVLLLVVAGVIGALSQPVASSGGEWSGEVATGEGEAPAEEYAEEEATREAAPPPRAAASQSGADDFIYTSPVNGMSFIAPNEIVAEGVNVTLVGEWRDDHRSIVFRLYENSRYDLSAGGGAISGRVKSDVVASTSAEQGTWSFEGSTLTLSPDGYGTTGIAEGRQSSGRGQADAPRQWNVVGVTIQYTPQGAESPKQRPGLRVTGQSPTWYYPSGEMNWVLRSAW